MTVVRVGTWNLENLFRPGSEAGPSDDETYQAKLASLAATIRGLDPDVLAVQEVGDPEALADLAGELDGYNHFETADPDGRGIRVGYLSRLALTDVRQISAFPSGLRPIQVDDTNTSVSAMGRPALHAAVTVDGTRIDLLTCHLKSKLLTFPGGGFSTSDEGLRARFGAFALFRRAAEAVTVRAAVTELLAGDGQNRAVLVLGDLNDVPQAATTQILYGPPGSEIGTGGYNQPDRGDRARLWNLADRILPVTERYSRIYQGRRELIDHILASHHITTRTRDGDLTAGPTPASIDDNPNNRKDTPGSDHRPLVLTLDTTATPGT